ncbi:MAG: hypothetical protein J1E60_08255 [Christensenellaceae bacterium]|nr:hypothetical protein [Christensenellaceae bacterium]
MIKMEALLAKIILWMNDLGTQGDYNSLLDEKFLEDPNNELLQELEWRSSDFAKTTEAIYHYFLHEQSRYSINAFGKALFAGLEEVYKANIISLEEFGARCYRLYSCLPTEVFDVEPFYKLSFADEVLLYCEEDDAREWYEEIFDFFK